MTITAPRVYQPRGRGKPHRVSNEVLCEAGTKPSRAHDNTAASLRFELIDLEAILVFECGIALLFRAAK